MVAALMEDIHKLQDVTYLLLTPKAEYVKAGLAGLVYVMCKSEEFIEVAGVISHCIYRQVPAPSLVTFHVTIP